jgi:hypothetical protein
MGFVWMVPAKGFEAVEMPDDIDVDVNRFLPAWCVRPDVNPGSLDSRTNAV